jgi:hypothetical protein
MAGVWRLELPSSTRQKLKKTKLSKIAVLPVSFAVPACVAAAAALLQ